MRWTLGVTGALVVLAGAAALVIGAFFGESVVRWALDRVERRSQIAVRYDHAKVSLLSGKVSFSGLSAHRAKHASSDLSLRARHVSFEFSPWTLLSSEPSLDRVVVRGLRGEVERKGASSGQGRGFVVRTLLAEDASVLLLEHKSPQHEGSTTKRWALVVSTYAATDVHRDSLLWDVLLRSVGRGTVDGHPFDAEVHYAGDFATTTWQVHDVTAAELLAARAPALQVSGTCKLRVTHKWVVSAPGTADSKWNAACEGLRLGQAVDAPGLRRISTWLAEKPRDVSLDFGMALGAEHFAGDLRSLVKPIAAAAGEGLVRATLQAAVQRAFIGVGTRLLDAAREITHRGKKAPAVDGGALNQDGGALSQDGGALNQDGGVRDGSAAAQSTRRR